MSESPATPQAPESKDPDERLFDLPVDVDTSHTKDLIDRAQHGDVEALNQLFKTYYDLMLELARKRLGAKLRGKEEADDLAQTTFREATRDFHAYVYRGEGSLLRWLVRILQNKIRDRAEFYGARKRDISREHSLDETSRDDPSLPRVPEPAARGASVARTAERHEEDRILREALSKLSPEHRQAITLVFFEGRQLKEAGMLMGGRTEDAVRMLLRRAEKNLHDLIRTRLDGAED